MADLCPEWGVIQSGGAPTTVTSSGSSAVVAIPTNAAGVTAKWCRICVTGFAHILPTTSGGSVTATTGILVSPNNDIILRTAGYTHIAYLQETASAKVNITPIEI